MGVVSHVVSHVYTHQLYQVILLFYYRLSIIINITIGLISVVLSTIQTRYHFTSLAAGFIVIAYDVSVAISIVCVQTI